MGRWTEGQITEALALAVATSIREASRQTGIPLATLHRHMQRAVPPEQRNRPKHGTAERNGTERVGQKLEAMANEVRERAVAAAAEKVTEAITERLAGMADRLYRLADKAVTKVDVAISDPHEVPPGKQPEPHDRDGAAWLRSLVGVMAQAIDKAQLLSGKPTARPEVTERHEYDITQRIITDPEAAQLAESLLRRAAGRDASPLRLDDQRGPVDAI